MYFSGLDFFQTWIEMDKMTHCHLNKTMPCMYITLEVFYLKHSGGNTNVIKLQKIISGQHLILILNLIIKTSCLHHLILLLMINLKRSGSCVDFGGTIIILLI